MVSFVDDLLTLIDDFDELILMRVYLKDQCDPQDLMAMFVEHVVPESALIAARDDKFFLDETHDVFSKMAAVEGAPAVCPRIWRDARLSDADRGAIWDWLKVLVQIAEKYTLTAAAAAAAAATTPASAAA